MKDAISGERYWNRTSLNGFAGRRIATLPIARMGHPPRVELGLPEPQSGVIAVIPQTPCLVGVPRLELGLGCDPNALLRRVRLPFPPNPHMAPPVGFEPTTCGLTVRRATAAPRGNVDEFVHSVFKVRGKKRRSGRFASPTVSSYAMRPCYPPMPIVWNPGPL